MIAGLSAAALMAFCAVGNHRGQSGLDVSPHFEPNLGQASSDVSFYGRMGGVSVAILADGALLSTGGDHFRLRFVGADPTARMVAEGPLPGRSSYFLGADAAGWCADVPHTTAVRAIDLYSGVDAVYRWSEGEFEYDLIVEPGADVRRIELRLELGLGVELRDDGSLRLRGAAGDLAIRAPRCRTEGKVGVYPVDCRYATRPNGRLGFVVEPFPSSARLVIDPRLAYSSFLGGPSGSGADGVTLDGQGNTFLVGSTASSDFPVPAPVTLPYGGRGDVMVAKLDSTGTSLLYSTYFGGSSSEYGMRVKVDTAGDAYVVGETRSADFPLVNAFQSSLRGTTDAFVVRLNATGTALVYSTYYGGSGADLNSSSPSGASLDQAGNLFIAGSTRSADLPLMNPIQGSLMGTEDALVAQFGPTGALVFASYLGGSSSDYATSVGTDGTGGLWLGGMTASADFPLISPIESTPSGGFLTRLDLAGGVISFSTYLGVSSQWIEAIAVGPDGRVAFAGTSNAAGLPVIRPVQAQRPGLLDAFIGILDPAGPAIEVLTYLGGQEDERVRDIAVNSLGSVIVSGTTQSLDFPVVLPVQATYGGASSLLEGDGFVAMMPRLGRRLVFSTYLGGSRDEAASGVASDSQGDVVVGGWTKSPDFPVVAPYQASKQGLTDAFFARIACEAPGPVGATLLATKVQSGSAILLNWQDIAGAEEFVARTDLLKSGTFPIMFGRAANGVDGLVAPLPPEALVFVRLAAATLCGEGPL